MLEYHCGRARRCKSRDRDICERRYVDECTQQDAVFEGMYMRLIHEEMQRARSWKMISQTGLGCASTRQLSQPPIRGDWGLPRYSRRPHLPTAISVTDFRKFKNNTPKNDQSM